MPEMSPAPKLIDPDNLTPFVDALPVPAVAKAAETHKGKALYRIAVRECFLKVHRDVPATRFWGYGGTVPGPTIEAGSGEEIFVEWPNDLPAKHFLPIDHNLMGAEADQPEVRTVVHLHGGKAAPESDGYPEDWYVPGGRLLTITPTGRKQLCCGITTTPWASTG